MQSNANNENAGIDSTKANLEVKEYYRKRKSHVPLVKELMCQHMSHKLKKNRVAKSGKECIFFLQLLQQ